jgi:nicotinate-nucleotide adenylyltransferase
MNAAVRIGILGGTLDPIHMGHLDAVAAAREALSLDRVLIVPAHIPPHRSEPVSSPFHRFAMAALAISGIGGLEVSDLELASPGPSYTADTLPRLQTHLGLLPSQIFFIIGADAFAEIETWSRYPAVLDLAHFVVVSRPGLPLSRMRDRLPQLRHRMRLPRRQTADTVDGTLIFLVDAPTADVSSTAIRQRITDGASLSGMVPPAVESHILQHGLYSNETTAD